MDKDKFSLIPKSLRSSSKFGQEYARTHPDVSPHDIERKYLKALDVFFGVKRSAQDPPEDNREGAGVKMTGRVRKTFGANRTQFIAPFEERTYVPVASAGAGGDVIISVDKFAECALPEWMIEALNLAPKGGKDKLEVWYNLRDKLYVFGVCGATDTQFSMVKRFVESAHPFLSKFYPKSIAIPILNKLQPPSEYFYGGENGEVKDGKVVHGHEGFWAHVGVQAKDFKDFLNNDLCLVSGIHWRFHERLVIKNPTDRIVYIIDPHGAFGGWFDQTQPKSDKRIQDETFVERLNRVVFQPRARTGGYTQCRMLDRRKVDQGTEGSCVAQSFLRGIYILFKSHLNPGRSLLDFVNDDIPCVFAVFVSKLFQRSKIITSATLQDSLAKTRADDEAVREIHEKSKARVDEEIARIRASVSSVRNSLLLPTSTSTPSEMVRYTPFSNSGGRSMTPGAGFVITNKVSLMSNALIRVPIDVAFALAGIRPGSSFEVNSAMRTGHIQAQNQSMSEQDGTVQIEIPESEHTKLWKAYKDNYEDVIFEIAFNTEFLSTLTTKPELRKYFIEPYVVRTIANGDNQMTVA